MSVSDTEDRYQELAQKWLKGTITPEEMGEFTAWYEEGPDEPIIIPETHAKSEAEHQARLFHLIRQRIARRKHSRIFRISMAAAAFAILLLSSLLLIYNKDRNLEETLSQQATQDIPPGESKAMLRLQDGTVLPLSEVDDGVIRETNGVRITKENDEIVYEPVNRPLDEIVYNTIIVPRGGQYKLRLPDGSQVWLNAASSLRYPVAFTGDQRYVELTGEAYFDISPIENKPFRINVDNKSTIEVLGTSFNVTAYPDEPGIETTLIEGQVKVYTPEMQSVLLQEPAQQSFLDRSGNLTVRQIDHVEVVVAWKNGIILFQNAPLQSIMRQISRWYDVEVEYRGNPDERLFTGGISRKSNLSSLLKILELNDVNFTMEGNRIIVEP